MAIKQYMPIGIQNFEKLRKENCVYVDKTQYVYSLAQVASPYFLSRPRRFGKSLFLSTLAAFFEGKKDLFKGLAIEKLEEKDAKEKNRDAWQKYPVFHIDFNSANYSEKNALYSIIDSCLRFYEMEWGKDENDTTLSSRFIALLRTAHQKTGMQAVILVDEYDKPLLETIENPELQEENRKTLKSFFGVIKSEDAHIRFAFLTGVTKFSQVSIFSDLNNLRDISMNEQFNEICGISEKELTHNFKKNIKELAKKNELSEEGCYEKLRKKYDGYHFSENSVGMYNPFSLLNTFASLEFKYYWIESEFCLAKLGKQHEMLRRTPTFLVRLMEKSSFDFKPMLSGIRASSSLFSEYRFDATSPIPVLYQSGYLTIKDYDSSTDLYTLGFPNDEVKYGFMNYLLKCATPNEVYDTFFVGNFIADLKESNLESMMNRLQSLFAAIPYNVYGSRDNVTEQTFQQTMFLVFNLMGQFTQAEIHSAKGRADCVVWMKDAIYVFEFKLEGTAEEALKQIDDKSYAVPYKSDKRKVVKIGVAFEKDKPLISDWVIV